VVLAARFLMDRSNRSAKLVFHFSLIYLPILLIGMIIDGPRF
jgi:heme O synthase-like polyprenyltransferase